MTIEEVYEKYKNMDKRLQNIEWIEGKGASYEIDSYMSQLIFELWQAIKEEVEKENVPGK